MNRIQRQSPLAANLLNRSAYFHNEDIPHFLLKPLADSQKNNPDLEIFETALGMTARHSMMKINKEKATVSQHRVLQEVIQLKGPKQSNPFKEAHFLLLEMFPYGESLQNYQQKTRLVPHLETVLRHLDKYWLDVGLEVESTLKSLLDRLGDGYRVIGDSRKQRDVLERATIILEKHYGPDHPEVAIILTSLGNAYVVLKITQKTRIVRKGNNY